MTGKSLSYRKRRERKGQAMDSTHWGSQFQEQWCCDWVTWERRFETEVVAIRTWDTWYHVRDKHHVSLMVRSKVLPWGCLGRSGRRNVSQMSLEIMVFWMLLIRIIGRQISENVCEGVSRLGQLRWGDLSQMKVAQLPKFWGAPCWTSYIPRELGTPFHGFLSH